jgi:hypothetical protein
MIGNVFSYYPTGTASDSAPVGGAFCAGLDSGYVADHVVQACWAVHAMAIPVNSSSASLQGAFDAANMWFKVNGSFGKVPTQLGLNGTFSRKS